MNSSNTQRSDNNSPHLTSKPPDSPNSVRQSSSHHSISTKGVPVIPSGTSKGAQILQSPLLHCRSFDSPYGKVVSRDVQCRTTEPRIHSSGEVKTSLSSDQLNQLRHRPDLAARSIDCASRTRSDKYVKTVRKSARQKSRQERIAKLDDAIFELEQMYAQLRLNDEELLDRAERRDLPNHLQLLHHKSIDQPYNSVLDTHVPYSRPSTVRAPPFRRSAIPDLIEDDLAVRRLQTTSLQNSRSAGDLLSHHVPPRGYMGQCAAYEPHQRQLVTRKDLYNVSEPNPKLDDFTYRRLVQADGANVPPPHPPFGIPLQPIVSNPLSDYMHIEPEKANVKRKPLTRTKQSTAPDPLSDDLALRTWRKDLLQKTERDKDTSNMKQVESEVNTNNPYSNLLRSTSATFYQPTNEPMQPVGTKSVAASYLEKCKRNLKPTRCLTLDSKEQVNFTPVCKSVSSGHIGGPMFARIQQNLNSMNKENHALSKNQIYSKDSKSPSPLSASRPPSSTGSASHPSPRSSAQASPLPPKGLLFRNPSKVGSKPMGEQQLEHLLSNLHQIPQTNCTISSWPSQSEYFSAPARHSMTDYGKSEASLNTSPEPARSQSACPDRVLERPLRPQVPFFIRQAQQLQNASPEKFAQPVNRPILKQTPVVFNENQSPSPEAVSISEHTKSQVSNIRQLFERKTSLGSYKSPIVKKDTPAVSMDVSTQMTSNTIRPSNTSQSRSQMETQKFFKQFQSTPPLLKSQSESTCTQTPLIAQSNQTIASSSQRKKIKKNKNLKPIRRRGKSLDLHTNTTTENEHETSSSSSESPDTRSSKRRIKELAAQPPWMSAVRRGLTKQKLLKKSTSLKD